MYRKILLPIILFTATFSQAQKIKKEDKQLMSNLQTHISFLASDALQGRRTGTEGEKLAAEYISTAFKKLGLLPKGTAEYYQAFEVAEGKQINAATHLMINENSLVAGKDFFPLAYSANASVAAMPSVGLHEAEMPWFYNVKELMEENKSNPHFDLAEGLKTKVADLQKKGATAVVCL